MIENQGMTDDPLGSSDREIVLVREFDAPRPLVFRAWTDAEHVGQWWGPRGFTTTTHVMDVRPGGMWRFVMHGPDGTDYKNVILYTDVEAPERLAYRQGGEEEFEHIRFRVVVTFEQLAAKRTRVTLRMTFDTPEERTLVVEQHGAVEGGRQTLERLGEHLARADTDDA